MTITCSEVGRVHVKATMTMDNTSTSHVLLKVSILKRTVEFKLLLRLRIRANMKFLPDTDIQYFYALI